MSTRQYIGARYVIKVYENSQNANSAEWEANTYYEPLVMVTYNNSSYLSKKDVPATVGNPVDNPNYWVVTGYYNGQIQYLSNEISLVKDRIVTPEMFGAVGDGITDDTIAVQTAIDTGKYVLFTNSYAIASSLTISNPTSIYGLLSTRSTSGTANKPSLILLSNYSDNTVINIRSTNVNIENLFINGDGNVQTAIYFASNVYYCTLKNIDVNNFTYGYLLSRTWNVVFERCIANNTNQGFRIADTSTSITWISCIVYTSAYGWLFEGATVYSNLISCATDHCTTGIRLDASGMLVCNNFGVEDYDCIVNASNVNSKVTLIGIYSYNRTGNSNPSITGSGTVHCISCKFNDDDTFSIDKLYGYMSNTPCHDTFVDSLYHGATSLQLPQFVTHRTDSSAFILPDGYVYILHIVSTDNSASIDVTLDNVDVDNSFLTYTAASRLITPKRGLVCTILAILKNSPE